MLSMSYNAVLQMEQDMEHIHLIEVQALKFQLDCLIKMRDELNSFAEQIVSPML